MTGQWTLPLNNETFEAWGKLRQKGLSSWMNTSLNGANANPGGKKILNGWDYHWGERAIK